MGKRWAALAAGIVLGGASAAMAAPVNYNFSGTFNSGLATGTYSGSFVYETTTSTVTSANATVSAGLRNDGTPRSAATYNQVTRSSSQFFVVSNLPTAAGNRAFMVQFLGNDLNSPTPQITMAYDAPCGPADCRGVVIASPEASGSAPPVTLIQTPPPATVPTMTEWAIILFGLLLAGGAVLHLGRRRGWA